MRVEDATQKAKKGLLSAIFSRSAIGLLLILLQIGIIVFGMYYMSESIFALYWVFTFIGFLAVIHIINKKGNPAFKLAWIIPVLALPVVGVTFYLFCQMQLKVKYLAHKLQTLWIEIHPYMTQNEMAVAEVSIDKPANANLAKFLSSQVGYPLHRNTAVKYFPLGEDKFAELLVQLKKAETYIFMEYFIVEKGEMWAAVLDVLKKKVKEGVEVRFMYDGMCSIEMLPYGYPKYLQSLGLKCKMFSPIKPVISTAQNNRDHRKICVIDGKVGFTGGINLGDEYINRRERFGHWKDTAVMLEGEAVQSLTMMFLQMWNIDEKEPEHYERYLTPKADRINASLGYVLPYGDSPYDDENVGEQVYFHVLNHAKKYVHIMTPYLIIDNEMLTNLVYTAKCGIEVIIIMPHIPDKWYAFALAKTYYEELIAAGVQIYEYTPGFVHAKVFISDDDTATVGTFNLDYRSLYLHFECGAFIYNNPVVREIETDFQETLKKCQKISLVDVKNRSFKMKAVGNVLRIIAPLM